MKETPERMECLDVEEVGKGASTWGHTRGCQPLTAEQTHLCSRHRERGFNSVEGRKFLKVELSGDTQDKVTSSRWDICTELVPFSLRVEGEILQPWRVRRVGLISELASDPPFVDPVTSAQRRDQGLESTQTPYSMETPPLNSGRSRGFITHTCFQCFASVSSFSCPNRPMR